MDNEEKEIHRILDAVAKAGAYDLGHIVWMRNLAKAREEKLQNSLIDLLGIRECQCDQ